VSGVALLASACGGLAEGGGRQPLPDGVPEQTPIGTPGVPSVDPGPLAPEPEDDVDAAPGEGRCLTNSYTRASVRVRTQAALEALRNCTEVRGNLTIYAFEGADLTPLARLQSVQGTLTLGNPFGQSLEPALPSLAGLASLTHVGGLVLRGVQATSLQGLSKLSSVGGSGTDGDASLFVSSCPRLRDLRGLDSAVGFQNIYIDQCEELGSLDGLVVGSELGSLSVSQTPLDRLDALKELSQVRGTLAFTGTTMRTAQGLDQLRSADALSFGSNPQLSNLRALNILMQVNQLIVLDNATLQILPDFDSLVTLRRLMVFSNPALQWMGSMPRLQDIESVIIQSNPLLTNVTALSSIQRAASIEIDHNPSLVQLELGALQSVSALLRVAHNPELDASQIATPPMFGGPVIIGGNRGDLLSLDPCPWSGDGVCVGPPDDTLCAEGADSDCRSRR
jgi:hypothetical protein